MSVRKLRRGEWLVVLGLVALVASSLLDWFSFEGADGEGDVYVLRGYGASSYAGAFSVDGGNSWTGLGLPWSVLLVLAGLAMLGSVVQAARSGGGRPTYGALATVVLALPLTFVVLVATAVRVLLATPGFEVSGGRDPFSIGADPVTGSWIGLAALLVGVIGLWVALADDRTTLPDGAAPPAPRDVPPPRPAVS